MRVLQFLAVVLTALALVPAGCHFLSCRTRLALSQDRYFTVKQIYRAGR